MAFAHCLLSSGAGRRVSAAAAAADVDEEADDDDDEGDMDGSVQKESGVNVSRKGGWSMWP